jgi:protein-tyrosine-phosphatase
MSVRARVSGVWNDPVWSKVIASGIVAGCGYLLLDLTSTPSQRVSVLVGLLVVVLLAVRMWPRRRRTLLFLSAGGTCRDPMAKAILTKLLDTRKLSHPIDILAAGVSPIGASEASFAARYVIKQMYGEDLLKDHRPTQLTADLVRQVDLILAMDEAVVETANRSKGMSLPKEKAFVLKKFFNMEGVVFDPWPDGKDAATLARYKECAEELRGILCNNLDQLVRVLQA